ncbi:hypothetical protein P692DRAFT_20871821 [Suillus brevipes Sb2]|nr:hypothetical protein P692DRAFT_20871821 [Suillus brevipes Sb2]
MGPPASIGNNIPPGPSVIVEDISIMGPWSTGPYYTGYYAEVSPAPPTACHQSRSFGPCWEVSPAPPTASCQYWSSHPHCGVLRGTSPDPSPEDPSQEVSPAPPTASCRFFGPCWLFVKVPYVPPSWKVKAIQWCSSSAIVTPSTPGERCSSSAVATPSAPARVNTPSSAQRTDPGELIPQIACMSQPLSSQHSAITDVAIDEDLEDAVDGLGESQ